LLPRNEKNERFVFSNANDEGSYSQYIPNREEVFLQPTSIVNETLAQKDIRELNKFKKVNQIWQEFASCYFCLKKIDNFPESFLNKFEIRLKNWLKLFLSVYPPAHVTPYMHIVVCHSKEILKRHGSIHRANTEVLEKTNSQSKSGYHRGTNRKTDEWMITLMELRNIRELESIGVKNTFEISHLLIEKKKRRVEIDRYESLVNFPTTSFEQNFKDRAIFNEFQYNDESDFEKIKLTIMNLEIEIKTFIAKCQKVKTQQMYTDNLSKDENVKRAVENHLNNEFNDMYEAIHIKKDASSLFKSISMCLFNTEIFHLKLRLACMWIIYKNQSYFVKILKNSFPDIIGTDDRHLRILIYSLSRINRFESIHLINHLIIAALTILLSRTLFFFNLIDPEFEQNNFQDEFQVGANFIRVKNYNYKWGIDQSLAIVLHKEKDRDVREKNNFSSLIPTKDEPIKYITQKIIKLLPLNKYELQSEDSNSKKNKREQANKRNRYEFEYQENQGKDPSDDGIILFNNY